MASYVLKLLARIDRYPIWKIWHKVCILGARSKYNSALKEIIFLFCYVTLLLSNENTSFYS
ncbi:hypothetical protein APHNP_0260 [Anaplasma phagocytophilum str. ApNP]|uniref:Uncharacterized protein n=1 Tax=Anaplasma phagocytophilum str. ApNP TaxID=1359153 RepID=A0A0F3NHP4_ANAPH|nr:hypothetical protein APHNP_0260 [Anaplasma phagocytophilum str. ApNP]